MRACLLLFLPLFAFGSEPVEIHGGILPAPGAGHCVRLRASGNFRHAKVRVNDIAAGELDGQRSELDITGYASLGAANTIEVRPSQGLVERVWAVLSPLVYIASATLLKSGELEIIIANTTENTAHVEIGGQQFTVSPGTSATRRFPWTGGVHIRMRAVSDGLDNEFKDEADAIDQR